MGMPNNQKNSGVFQASEVGVSKRLGFQTFSQVHRFAINTVFTENPKS